MFQLTTTTTKYLTQRAKTWKKLYLAILFSTFSSFVPNSPNNNRVSSVNANNCYQLYNRDTTNTF